MKRKTWITAAAALLVVGISAVLYVQSHSKPAKQQTGNQGAPSLTFKVTREDLINSVEVKGKTSYQNETYVNAPFTADVKSWAVTDGAQVKRGDTLFVLDTTSLDDEIAQLQASEKKQELELNLSEFQRETPAEQEAAAAGSGLTEREAKQRYADAKSRDVQEEIGRLNLQHMRSQLSQKSEKRKAAQFAAPEDGIFLFDSTKQPQSVKESERIGKIVDLTKLELVCYVGEYDLFHLKVGMPVDVRVDALKNTKLQGKVEYISKFAKNTDDNSDGSVNTAAAQFQVRISLEPNEQLIAGLSLTATIMTDKKPDTLVVSTLAIQRDKEQYYVMVPGEQGNLEKREVKIGLETPENTEIVSGLNEGDTVILQ
ncbi:efflux RND transporter periplasmic adaptor subunit [Paenibacillus doosanensis]|uniref:efflux RND transporter periplasmic adaptor subunit n=1 Tax=Paenibacillus doosanensis TaxID=1229154 RepID=UPI00217F5C39|nr:efflux RND transporter periplasmic adaptor subunit [Paenibacillus doosanensis]MCS7460174.1 efflux RND transporter periplasmic adaptor subunit [Paenibacillus doosanensis]